jgi:hypothetical protein
VNIGQHLDPGIISNAAEYSQRFLDSGSTMSVDGRAVGLIVRRFEDISDAGALRNCPDSVSHFQGVPLAFDNARAGDQKQFSAANLDATYLKGLNRDRHK